MTRKRISESTTPQAVAYMPTVFEYGVDAGGADPVAIVTDLAGSIPTANDAIRQFIIQNPEQAFDIMVSRFGLVLIMEVENQISVFSAQRRNKLPKALIRKIEDRFKTWPDTPVGWYSSLNADPQPITASEAIYGKAPVASRQPKAPKQPAPLSPRAKSELRSKFWGPGGGSDLGAAGDVVDKLLQ